MGSELDAYAGEVAAFWPGARVRLRPSRRPGAGTAYRFAVVAGSRRPRMLVPADNPRAAATALMRFSSALTPADATARSALAAVLRLGAARAMGTRLTVEDVPSGSLLDHLADCLGEAVDVSITLGTERANRKPVLQVFDQTGRVLAYAKVGRSPVTRAPLRQEAAALEALHANHVPQSLEVPRLIGLSKWHDLDVLLMSAMRTHPWQPPDAARRVPVREMEALSLLFDEGRRPLAELPWWQTLHTAPRHVTVDTPPSLVESAERLCSALAVVSSGGDRPVRVGAWHGDWTPWNQARCGHRLQLWDWERFETGVPTGLDRCHYGVNAECRRSGVTAAAVVAGLRLAGLDPREEDHHLVGALYLAAISTRYLRSMAEENGELVRGRALARRSAVPAGPPPGARGRRPGGRAEARTG